MARTDNTTPYRLLTDRVAKHAATFRLPRGTTRLYSRQWQKGQRQAARQALARGEQPAPSRHRHSVRWEHW